MGVKYLLCDKYAAANRFVKVQIKIRIEYPLAVKWKDDYIEEYFRVEQGK